MRISKNIENPKTEKDFDLMIKQMFSEHGNICFGEYNDEIYIYKLLSRKVYKNLIANPQLTQIEKEDEVCRECILWPRDFDPDECDAGLPTHLFEQIMTNSFLTGVDDMITLIEISRDEAEQLDSQMGCIINEAFPNYSMEEIESWDMIKFCQMFTKAEWKLKSLRNLSFDTDMLDFLKTLNVEGGSNAQETTQNEHTQNSERQSHQNTSNTIKVGNREMTMEEYRQYQEFQRQFPDINWEADAMYTGYETQTVSTVPTPLRIK